jgi:NADH-quinone oxidoreductase subunit H
VIAFATGVVILVMAVSSLIDRTKQQARAPKPEGDAPNFPVPSLPQIQSKIQSINVSGDK